MTGHEFWALRGVEENRKGVFGEEKRRECGSGGCGAYFGTIPNDVTFFGDSADRRTGTFWHGNQGEKARSIPAWTSADMSMDKKAMVLFLRISGLRFSV